MIGRQERTVFLATVLLASPAAGQRIELAPFVGYRSSSDLANERQSAGVSGDLTYGGMVTVAPWFRYGFEFLYSHLGTTVRRPLTAPAFEIVDLSVDQWVLGGVREFRPGRTVRPFLAVGLGIVRFYSDDFEGSDTQVAFSAGAGTKLFPRSGRIGLRLDARGYFTLTTAGSGLLCAPPSPCGLSYADDSFFQGEVSAAVVVALRGG